MRFIILKHTFKDSAVRESFLGFAVLEAFFPVAFILLTVVIVSDTIAVGLAFDPFAIVPSAFFMCFNSFSMEPSELPLAFVLLSVCPVELSITMGEVIYIVAFVIRTIKIHFLSLSIPFAVGVLAFKDFLYFCKVEGRIISE